MSLAARIYDRVVSLPQQAASEVLQFADFLAARYGKPEAASSAQRQDAAAFYLRFQADLSSYRFDRDEANAR